MPLFSAFGGRSASRRPGRAACRPPRDSRRCVGLAHGHLARFLGGRRRAPCRASRREVDHADLGPACRGSRTWHAARRRSATSISISLVVELAGSRSLRRKLLARRRLAPLPVSASSTAPRRPARPWPDALAALLAHQAMPILDEVAHDLLDVAADIADLGELGRLDLQEGRVGELGEAAGDLGLAAAGGADHQDVLGRDLLAQAGRSCWRRQRLRSAMATARLASFWPMMRSGASACRNRRRP
jgi:hypothetical protein